MRCFPVAKEGGLKCTRQIFPTAKNVGLGPGSPSWLSFLCSHVACPASAFWTGQENNGRPEAAAQERIWGCGSGSSAQHLGELPSLAAGVGPRSGTWKAHGERLPGRLQSSLGAWRLQISGFPEGTAGNATVRGGGLSGDEMSQTCCGRANCKA